MESRATALFSLALGLAIGVSAPARAETGAKDYARPGAYLQFAGSAALESFQQKRGADYDTSGGLNLRAGYRIHPRLAAEAHFEWLPKFGGEIDKKTDVDVEGWAATANAKAFLLTGRVQPFLFAGVGILDMRKSIPAIVLPPGATVRDGQDFAVRFGGGVDAYVTESFAFIADASFVMGTGDVQDYDLYSVSFGFLYRF